MCSCCQDLFMESSSCITVVDTFYLILLDFFLRDAVLPYYDLFFFFFHKRLFVFTAAIKVYVFPTFTHSFVHAFPNEEDEWSFSSYLFLVFTLVINSHPIYSNASFKVSLLPISS